MNITDQLADFDNVTQFLDHVSSPVANPHPKGRQSQDESSFNDRFTGVHTFSEAIELARHGWPEGLAQAAAFNATITPLIAGQLFEPEVRFDVTGDWIDMGRLMTGEPESFGEFVESDTSRAATPPKMVRVVVNVGASGGVSPDVIIKRGAAMCALVMALEKHNRRVQVDIVSRIQPTQLAAKSETFTVRLRAKNFGDAIHLDKVVYLMAHPSMLRRLVFSAREHSRYVADRFGCYKDGTYGRSVEVNADERGDVYIGPATLGMEWSSPECATEWVIDQLKAQGVAIKAKV